jgi:hypothetical protein
MKGITLALVLIFLCQGVLLAQRPIGIFDDHGDIGNPQLAGSASYDTATQTYTLAGSGVNLWFNGDEFQYIFKKIKGDFIATANFAFIGATGNAHRKIGWMLRESEDSAAAHVSAVRHGDGLTVMQWRELRGAYMRDPEDEIFVTKRSPDVIQLERIGQKIVMRIAANGEPLQDVGSHDMAYLKESVLIGLFICAHDPTVVERAKVWNVRIDQPTLSGYTSDPHAVPSPESRIHGSRLETVRIDDLTRKTVYETPQTEPLDKHPDASGVLFGPYYYDAKSTNGTMQILRTKSDGSHSEQLTFDEYHNWFPTISPDGKWIAFLSLPPSSNPTEPAACERAMLRLMPLSGGAPRVIAYFSGGKGSLGSWSPDSRSITFVSYY